MKVVGGKTGSNLQGIEQLKSQKLDQTKKNDRAKGVSSKDISETSKVNVSERAQLMQKAKDIASQPMAVDEAKVGRIQKLIDEGKYKVDASAVADKLVDEFAGFPDE